MSTAEDTLAALLATPLFAGVADELLDAVRTEAAIAAGRHDWPEGTAQRPGFVRFASVPAGGEIVRQGDLSTELVVVLDGDIEAVQARPGREPWCHARHGPGAWFGAISAHSHHPALATYRALRDARIAALDSRLFARLYAEDEGFRARIDDGYRQLLGLHLRASSLCRDLDDVAIAQLQAAAKLVTVEPDEVLAAQGAPADTFWLVRAGAIACVTTAGGRERVLAYYKGNATFGEHAIQTPDGTWPATYKALARSALVALPAKALRQLQPDAQRTLARAADRLLGKADVEALLSGSSGNSALALDELHVMVERESVKGGRALVIDRTKCVRCNVCVESCVAVHDDGIPRLSKVGTPVVTDEVLVTACYHCEVPQCMLSCEYAAIRRDPQGRVRFEYDNCVGCASCIDGCPYGVIRLVEPAPTPAPIQPLLAKLPWVGRFFQRPPAPAVASPQTGSCGAGGKVSQVTGKTIKCDLCAGLPFEACVYNCPTAAIVRSEPQRLFDRGRRR